MGFLHQHSLNKKTYLLVMRGGAVPVVHLLLLGGSVALEIANKFIIDEAKFAFQLSI